MDQPIIPLDEYVTTPDARIYPVRSTATNTADQLNEFNQVYDTYELAHLTPPETPPHTPPQTPLQPFLNDSKVNSKQKSKQLKISENFESSTMLMFVSFR